MSTDDQTSADSLLTLPEAADYLRLAKQTIYNLVNRGEIPYLKAGRQLRFRKSDLDAWLESGAATPTADPAST